MAVSTQDLIDLFRRVHNDNLPKPSELRRGGPAVVPLRRTVPNLNIDMPTLETRLDVASGVLRANMKHPERACFTPELMRDGQDLVRMLKEAFAGASADEIPFRYVAWTSAAKGAWSLGGDLSTFTSLIREQDEAGLRDYAYRSIDVLFENYRGFGLPVMTVALVNGDAVGGGFEAMLTSDLVIAERQAKFGLPEILFNLFPGMGAHAFLARKVGKATAKTLIEDGRTRSADEMHALGLVDILCDEGEAERTFANYIEETGRRFNTTRTLRRAMKRVDPVTREELIDIVDMWVELALELDTDDLRRMDCLARHQKKKRAKAG